MRVLRIRSGSVGRPFSTGNPGEGCPEGAPNKATREIKEFVRNFLNGQIPPSFKLFHERACVSIENSSCFGGLSFAKIPSGGQMLICRL
jgi:hypothetical protein